MSGGSGAYWSRLAPLYDVAVRLLLPAHHRMVEALVADAAGAARVLDLGAGTGSVSVRLAGLCGAVHAVDRAPGMLRALEEKRAAGSDHPTTSLQDAAALGFRTGSLDVVIAANLLHLLAEPAAALAEVRRVLRPGGRALLPTFCHGQHRLARALSRTAARLGFPVRHRFDERSLAALAGAGGLRVRRVERLPGLLPLVYLVAEAPAPER